MIPADLLDLLRCPQTLQPLTVAGPDVLAVVNTRISGGRVPGMTGTLLAALVRADGAVLYPVYENIPVLLAERAIALS